VVTLFTSHPCRRVPCQGRMHSQLPSPWPWGSECACRPTRTPAPTVVETRRSRSPWKIYGSRYMSRLRCRWHWHPHRQRRRRRLRRWLGGKLWWEAGHGLCYDLLFLSSLQVSSSWHKGLALLWTKIIN
jgi:hypothetical protein